MQMSYFFHPMLFAVAVVQIFHDVIIRSGGKFFAFVYHSATFGITAEHVAAAVVACGFIDLAPPAVENRYVVGRKLLDLVDDVIIVQTIAVGCNPLVNYNVTQIDRKSTRLNSSHVKISY